MTELAGFGANLDFLPRRVRLAQLAEERAEAQEAREAERDLAERVEARRSADLTLFASEAEQRGEYIDPVALATGRVTGRTFAEVLEAARLAADREDERAAAEARRARGERFTYVGELADPSARSRPMTPVRRAIEKQAEAFRASVAAERLAEERRAELEDRVPSLREPHWSRQRRRSASRGCQGTRIRNTGWVVGVR
jgi:hypothetical protein